MFLGLFVGILMPEYRAVLFGALAGALTDLLMFTFLQRDRLVAAGEASGTWLDFVIVAVLGYIGCLVIASIAYLIKRAFIPRSGD